VRVLLTTLAAAGHCYPLVPIAWALRNAGHDVRVASSADGVGLATSYGLVAVSTGAEPGWASYWTGMAAAPAPDVALDRAAHEAERARRSATMFADMNHRMVAPLLEMAAEWRPDLVVFEPRCFAGAILAQRWGVPAVRHCWGPDSPDMRCTRAVEPMQQLCTTHGIDWFRDEDGRTPLTGTHTVEPAPKALRPFSLPDAWATRFVPVNGAAVLAPRPPRPRPRVTVVWSRTFTTAGGHVAPVQTLLDALADEPVTVTALLSPEGRALLSDGHDDVEFLEGAPLEEVLPDTDLLVHAGHGGPTMTAVAAGCPQLVHAGIADGFLNGRLVADCGALDVDIVREQVRTILGDPSFRDCAADLRRENDATPGPAELAQQLAQLV
jgi:UDP:flavonoid glycosyltransferase YjiC (YdhE family)